MVVLFRLEGLPENHALDYLGYTCDPVLLSHHLPTADR